MILKINESVGKYFDAGGTESSQFSSTGGLITCRHHNTCICL